MKKIIKMKNSEIREGKEEFLEYEDAISRFLEMNVFKKRNHEALEVISSYEFIDTKTEALIFIPGFPISPNLNDLRASYVKRSFNDAGFKKFRSNFVPLGHLDLPDEIIENIREFIKKNGMPFQNVLVKGMAIFIW
jgi:hypothetical protein